MAGSPAAAATRLDRDYTQPTLQWFMGEEFYPVAGRYLYVMITASAGGVASGTGPDGLVLTATYTETPPVVGERWRMVRTVDGEYAFDDVAVGT